MKLCVGTVFKGIVNFFNNFILFLKNGSNGELIIHYLSNFSEISTEYFKNIKIRDILKLKYEIPLFGP